MGLLSPWCQSKTLRTTSQTRPPSPSPSADTVRTLSQRLVLIFSSELPSVISSETFIRRARSHLPYSTERFVCVAPRAHWPLFFPWKWGLALVSCPWVSISKSWQTLFFAVLCDDFCFVFRALWLFVRIRGDDSTELKVFCSSTQKKGRGIREKKLFNVVCPPQKRVSVIAAELHALKPWLSHGRRPLYFPLRGGFMSGIILWVLKHWTHIRIVVQVVFRSLP